MKKCKSFIQSPSYTSLIDSDNYQNDSTLFCELSSRAKLHVDMGAKVSSPIETLSREISGPDAACAIEKGDFSTSVEMTARGKVTT